MENTNGFYKYDENRNLFYAPNFVECSAYKLEVEQKESYTLPIDGWYYFDTETQAKDFFGIVDEVVL
jgi:hypothetical protein